MNKSFNGLEGLVKEKLKREMNEQDMFVFLNKQLYPHQDLWLQQAEIQP